MGSNLLFIQSQRKVCILFCSSVIIIFYLHLVCVDTTKMLDKVRCKKDQYGNDECSCPEEPITDRYPDLNDTHCDFYYLCHRMRAVKRKCGYQYAFHPKLRECLPRGRIPTNICKPLVECSLTRNSYVEDDRDCTKYYLCLYGQHTHWSCPEDAYFEPEGEKCVNDRTQAEACIEVAKRKFYKKVGHNEPPPKTSLALQEAKAHMKDKADKKKG